ncbi:hypothetical protein QVD99_003707 [Batrachochytrium dendrobatidis]|nr:hypothetical protein QVD99_003707 [Batrachochytrium dendrobatidis]
MISNGSFTFKDILAYLAPNTSLEKFLKAFDTEVHKGIFPLKVTQNLTKYADEHPELKKYSGNMLNLAWKRQRNFAISSRKLCNFFRSLNLDMHKDGISIPGLTLKYLWNTKDHECEFQLFKGNEELY